MSEFKARFAGKCAACGKAINVGDEIVWNRLVKKSTRHASCPDASVSVSDADILSAAAKSVGMSPVSIAVGEDGIAHIVKASGIDGACVRTSVSDHDAETVAEDKPKTRKARASKVASETVAKTLDGLAQNAEWYEILSAVLPHLSRILLVGPPATGKSTTAMKVAGCKYRVTMTETTSREDLIGMFHLIDGETKWVDGPVTSAMRNGETILIDEIDRYSPEAASLLYALIDDRPHLSLPNGDMLYASSGYKMIMTSNEGLETLPVAVQDRIEVILSANTPHEDAISDLPETLKNVTLCYYRALPKVAVKLPTTVRRMRTLHALLGHGMKSGLAANIVFGQSAEILSVLASMENAQAV